MKCFACNKKIKREHEMIHIGCDGDFVCNEKCKARYEKEKAEFFGNTHDDAWYKNYMNG